MLQLGRLGAAHLPIFLGIVFAFNLGTTYIWAIENGDVSPLMPYVSAAGDRRPESCLFSILLNISSMLIMVIVYIRYRLLLELTQGADPLLDRFNLISLIFGLVGAFGMCVVANFQETALRVVHLSGAFSSFGGGCLYMAIQSFLSIRMHPLYVNATIGKIRALIAAASTIAFFTALGFGTAASIVFHQTYPSLPTPHPWSRKYYQPGYNLHVVSALAEWVMAVLQIAFLLSYSRDFEKARVTISVESLVTHLDHSPRWRSLNDVNEDS